MSSAKEARKTMQRVSNASIIEAAPPPPFKIQYANNELENALATNTMKFKIGDYAFEKTFIIFTKTIYLLIGMAFLRNPRHSTRHYRFPENTKHLSFNR